jgi:hypothetical protein
MHIIAIVAGAVVVALAIGIMHVVVARAEEGGSGTTVQDVGRGLKSAAKNIEQELPKIGPAIVGTVKKPHGKASGKSSKQSSETKR